MSFSDFYKSLLLLMLGMSLQAQPSTFTIDSLAEEAFLLQDSYPDSAFSLARKVLSQSKQVNYKRGMGFAYMRLGSIHDFRGNSDSALFFLKRCYSIRLERNDFAGAAGACQVLNNIFEQTGMLDSAFYYAYTGLRLAEKHKLDLAYADFTFELGELNLNYGEADTAFYYFTKAFALSENLNDTNYRIKAAFGLGGYYYAEDKFEEALQFYLLGNKLIKSSQNTYWFAVSANNLAACYDQLNKPKEAKAQYQKAIEFYKELNYTVEAAESMNSLGALYYRNNAYDSAQYWYSKAYPILKSTSSHNLLLHNLLYQSMVHEALEQNEKALAFYKEYVNYKDSILDGEKVASIAEMQTKYDTEKKEQQIELLDEQNKAKAAQRNFLIAASSLLFLGLGFLGFYYRQRIILNKKDKELASERINTLLKKQEAESYTAMLQGQEEERQRIATDLHDRLGSMLSTTKLLLDASVNDGKTPKLEKATHIIDDAVKEVRRVSHNLSTGRVESYGLIGAVKDLAQGINQSEKLICKVGAYNFDTRLPAHIEVELYRVIQEVLNNTLKYAKASQVDIQMHLDTEEVRVSIDDNGIGFKVKQQSKAGIGLYNLKKRIERLQGNLHIESNLGKGTLVHLEVPLKEKTV